MKVFTVASAMLVTTLFVQATAVSQQPSGNSAGIVAVLDVGKVFENHDKFNSQMEAIKQEVKAFDTQMKARGKALQQEVLALKDSPYEPTSPEYKTAQADLARKDAELKIQASQKRQEILDKEAQVHLSTYREVQGIVAKLAGEYNITLVLRHNSAEIDPSDRASVIAGINRPVIFQSKLDLTSLVIPKVKTRTASK